MRARRACIARIVAHPTVLIKGQFERQNRIFRRKYVLYACPSLPRSAHKSRVSNYLRRLRVFVLRLGHPTLGRLFLSALPMAVSQSPSNLSVSSLGPGLSPDFLIRAPSWASNCWGPRLVFCYMKHQPSTAPGAAALVAGIEARQNELSQAAEKIFAVIRIKNDEMRVI